MLDIKAFLVDGDAEANIVSSRLSLDAGDGDELQAVVVGTSSIERKRKNGK